MTQPRPGDLDRHPAHPSTGSGQAWGRNLSYHPHIHYLVPAGGLASDHRTWLPAHHHFLLPVKALSRIFRAKFLHALKRSKLANDIPATIWKHDWVVHCEPVGNGRTALKYLAPYIFRVAISNRRLVKLENNQVTFRYRSSDTGQIKFCTLSAEDFIHRFLQHVLPRGFVKVRYFGFFGSSQRLLLAALRLLLETDTHSPLPDELPPPSPTLPKETFLCPSGRPKGKMAPRKANSIFYMDPSRLLPAGASMDLN